MVEKIINDNRTVFAVKDVLCESYLKNVRRTAFTWTKHPHTLCLAMDKKYVQQAILNPNVSAIITPLEDCIKADKLYKAVILTPKANELYYFLHNQALHSVDLPWRDNKFTIHPTAQIDTTCFVGENVSIGENVIIHRGCIIHDNTVIGDDCVLYENVTLGTEGFFSKAILGNKTHISHFGGVLLGSNCIVHTGCNISRSVNVNECTTLGNNVHIGIHTNIGHDCQIGSNTDISAKVLLAGRVSIGDNCWIGASVSISNAVRVGIGANIKIGSVVIEDVEENASISGNFAFSHVNNLKQFFLSKGK